MLKRFLSLTAAVCLCLAFVALPAAAAEEFLIEDGVLIQYQGSGGDVVIPDGVTQIGFSAFENAAGVTNVTIPHGVTSIGDMAFTGCTSLTGVTIPSSVTGIGSLAFSGCTSLAEVTIPDSVTEIGGYAFSGCTGLGSVTLPKHVTKIDEYTFYQCYSLDHVVIPEGVTEIGAEAFGAAASLIRVTIPASVSAIAADAFSGNSNLTIYGKAGSEAERYAKASGSLFSTGDVRLEMEGFEIQDGILKQYNGPGGDVTIPDGVSEIGYRAFAGCTSLTSVTVPDGVITIGAFAFERCTGLTRVVIPLSVSVIGEWAFQGCTSLTDVTLPDRDIEIGSSAFKDTPWQESFGEFHIWHGALLHYGGAGGDVTIPDGVTKIGGAAFFNCDSVKSVTIPDGVTEIGGSAFSHCTGLTRAAIPDSVGVIGKLAFYTCPDLTIYGEVGSAAERYAKGNDIPFAAGSPATLVAYATASPILVDGARVEFQTYGLKDADGNMTNYVKLRDIASAVNGTAAQFEVVYDGAIGMETGRPYTPNGSEMETPFTGDRTYTANTGAVKVDGTAVSLSAILLTDDAGGGYTYFKLRDLGKALGFNVSWDGAAASIVIDTDQPYSED